MRFPRLAQILLAALALLALGAAGSAIAGKQQRTLNPNPADHPDLIDRKLDPNRYDGANGCRKRHPKGMRKLIRFMKRNTKRKTVWGTIRCDGGVHGTGRALDWMLDARKKGQKRKAKRVINTWFARDRKGRRNALARRMGIQLIIYNCRVWIAGDRKTRRYSACSGGKKNADPTQGHIDHMHIELTKPAARLRTTYWKFAPKADKGGGGSGGVNPSGKGRRTARAAGGGRGGPAKPRAPLHPPEAEQLEAYVGQHSH